MSKTLHSEEIIISYSLKCIDVTRVTHSTLDIDVTRVTHSTLEDLQENRIDDYWNIDESRDLSDSWTGFILFSLMKEKLPEGYMWSGESLTKRQATSGPEIWRSMSRNSIWKKNRIGQVKNQRSRMPESPEEFISSIQRTRNLRSSWKMEGRNWKYKPLQLLSCKRAKFWNRVTCIR